MVMPRGGARPGAGRPKVVHVPERIAIDVEKRDLDALRRLADRRKLSLANAVREAIRDYIARKRRATRAQRS